MFDRFRYGAYNVPDMKRLSVFRLGLSYAGMYFGAGFVSGRELYQFFGAFGSAGYFGMALSGLLFFLAGAAFFDLAAGNPGKRVGELLVPGHHPFLSGLVEGAEGILLFGVVVIMTAGAGAMVRQVTGFPAWAAGLLFAAVLFVLSLKDIRSAVTVFAVLAPCLTASAVLTAGYILLFKGGGNEIQGAFSAAASVIKTASEGGTARAAASAPSLIRGPLSAGLLYAVYNLFGSFSIMLAMVPLLPDRKGAFAGTGLGALFLLFPAACMTASMLAVPQSAAEEIPTVYLAGLLSPWFRGVYSILMLAGMASAALGCLVGFLQEVKDRVGGTAFPYRRASAASLAAAWILSLFGFGNLIGFIYPLFGYLGFPCIVSVLLQWGNTYRKQCGKGGTDDGIF